jgi:hypothetical protein
MEDIKMEAKKLANKVGKIMDTTNKLATKTTLYHDALLARPI